MPYSKKWKTSGSIANVLLEQVGIWKEKNSFTKVKDKWIGVIVFIFVFMFN